MTRQDIQKIYFQGVKDAVILVRRGILKGLSLEDSLDSLDKSIDKSIQQIGGSTNEKLHV